jgi:hypothetical protein
MTTGLVTGSGPDGGPAPLDPALLRVIRPSASRLAADEGTFVHLLHEDIAGALRHLPDGGWGCCERIVQTVLWVVLAQQPPQTLAEGLSWLGAANQAEGFPVADYVSVGQALVRVVRDMSGSGWTTQTGSAWIGLFMWMQPHLRAAADQVAAQQEAARRHAAAQQEAAQRQAFDHARRGVTAGTDISAVAGLLDGEDDDDAPGYGQIMMGMTVNRRRDH